MASATNLLWSGVLSLTIFLKWIIVLTHYHKQSFINMLYPDMLINTFIIVIFFPDIFIKQRLWRLIKSHVWTIMNLKSLKYL